MSMNAGVQGGSLSWCLRAAAMATALNWSAHGAGAGRKAGTKKMASASIARDRNWAEGEAHYREKLPNRTLARRKPGRKSEAKRTASSAWCRTRHKCV